MCFLRNENCGRSRFCPCCGKPLNDCCLINDPCASRCDCGCNQKHDCFKPEPDCFVCAFREIFCCRPKCQPKCCKPNPCPCRCKKQDACEQNKCDGVYEPERWVMPQSRTQTIRVVCNCKCNCEHKKPHKCEHDGGGCPPHKNNHDCDN